MTALTADALLAGPRGRRLCLELTRQLNDDVHVAAFHASLNPADVSLRRALLDALAAVDPSGIVAWRDPLAFAEAMDRNVCAAMGWQEPDGDDLVLAGGEVAAALRPLAEAVVSAPATEWWTAPVELSALRYTDRHNRPPRAPEPTDVAEPLRRWRETTVADDRSAAATRPADPAASHSGRWWSTPAWEHRLTTTRPLPGLGSLTLIWEEDSLGGDEATIWPLATSRTPRIWEIDGPDSWLRLVAAYPLDVSHGRKHDWYRVTGRAGRWLIPDWVAVAADWDAVHLSVAGYLTTATRSLPLADGAATVLAGWDPDQTWWLTDILTAAGPPERWTRPDDDWYPGR